MFGFLALMGTKLASSFKLCQNSLGNYGQLKKILLILYWKSGLNNFE